MKKKLALLISLAILVSVLGGCSRGKEKNPALAWIDPFQVDASQKLYYEEIPVADMPYIIEARYVEGRDVFVGLGEGKLYVFDKDGKVLKEIAAGASSYTVTYDGEIYALSQESQKGSDEIKASNGKVSVYDLEGNKGKEIKLEDCSYKAGTGSSEVPKICLDGEKRICILYPGTRIKVLNGKGSVEKDVETTANLFVECDAEDSLITGEFYNKNGASVTEVKKLDEQYKEKWKAQLYGQSMVKSPIVKGEYLYYMDQKGVQRVDRDGKGIYVLQYDDQNKIVNPMSAYLCNVDGDRSLYFLIGGGKTTKLYKYSQSKEAEENFKNKKIIRVQLYCNNPPFERSYSDLTMAAKYFNSEHNDYRVEISLYRSKEDTNLNNDKKNLDDYALKTNTKILAGKEDFDIISTYGLPFGEYAEEGVFADLGEFMDSDSGFKKEDYYNDVLEGLKYKGKLYGMPMGLGGDCVAVNMDLAQKAGVTEIPDNMTFDEFLELAKRLTIDSNNDGTPEQYGVNRAYDSYMAGSLIYGNIKYFVDGNSGKANFDNKNFTGIFTFLKKLQDSGCVAPPLQVGNNSVYAYDVGYNKTSPEYIKASAMCFASFGTYSSIGTLVKMMGTSNIKFIHLPGFNKENGSRSFFSEDYGDPDDMGVLAISSHSSMKKEAWEFIKFLTSKFYESYYGINFKINKSYQERSIGLYVEGYNEYNEGKLTENLFREAINYITGNVKYYDYTDQRVKSIIDGEINSIFNGNKPVEESAKDLQNKISIYLNE